MNTCESCRSWPKGDIDKETNREISVCNRGISQGGYKPSLDFGCTLWEGKPVEFETTFERVRCAPGIAAFPERDLLRIGEAFYNRKFKVTLEPVEEEHDA